MTGDALLPTKSNGTGSKPGREPPTEGLFRPLPSSDAGGVRVQFIAACPGDAKEHRHDEVEILLPLGSAEFDLGWSTPEGKPELRRLREGQLALIGSRQPHSVIGLQLTGLVVLHVAVGVAEELGGAKLDGVSVHDFARLARDDLVIWDLSQVFRRLLRVEAPRSARYLASLATVFATHVLQAHFRSGTLAPDRPCLTPAQLRTVTDFIAAHLKEPLTTAAIAKKVHLSAFHFTRLFKGSTGLAPRRYLIKCRVIRAQEMLRTGNFRVAHVAHDVGFCDQSHLDRQFRRHFGFPPKVLLKQHRAQESS